MSVSKPGDLRYQAAWVKSMGDQPAYPASFNPDAVERGSKLFDDRQAAIDHAHSHDVNDEGKVYVEELFNDGIPDDWREVEAIYCFEDGTTETESRRY